jgi:hypothetical protein
VIEYPGGVPGDIAITIAWGTEGSSGEFGLNMER